RQGAAGSAEGGLAAGEHRVPSSARSREPRPDDTGTGVRETERARLADQHGVGLVAAAKHGPHAITAALLLDHRREEEIAAPVVADLGDRGGGDEVRSQAALHVARPAAPDPAVDHLSRPRLVLPEI